MHVLIGQLMLSPMTYVRPCRYFGGGGGTGIRDPLRIRPESTRRRIKCPRAESSSSSR
ncbi:hypothetical protein K435DRAFT_52240 [Dendrothele bispora CBS 962.96]|uniref:Uncharacterized protein n=1 Tax=Dendrothele bispora (strain CBS 962.96) TaxID=1314807 RepID=A0A4S8M694_DENBC|nr:hypothetical protein K435DRAFT_52240 [Dendrothele bispora CBS 962.96]